MRLSGFFFLFVFLLSTGVGYSQSSKIDSLKALIEGTPVDSTKVDLLIQLSGIYLDVDVAAAIEYGNQAQTIAQRMGAGKGLGYAYKAIAMGYYNQSNYPEALVQYQHSLSVFEGINFKTGIANILSNIGAIYYNIGDDTKSIEYHLRSLKVSEEIGDKRRIGTSMNNIGSVYNNTPATVDQALEYYLKALSIFTEISYDDGIGTISGNIGELYFGKAQFEKALPYFEKALEVYAGTIDAAFPLTHLGQIYAERGDFSGALDYHSQAIEISEKMDGKLELAQSLLGLAGTQVKQAKLRDAIGTYKRAERVGESVTARKEVKTAYEELSKAYASMGDFKNAYFYETLFTAIKDTLFNSDEINKRQRMQFNFDMDKKEAEISLQDATIQRQRILNYAAAVTGFLLILLVIGIYNRYTYTRKTNKIIKDERDRSKDLLLNILPEETARELETHGHAKTRYYENVTVLFTDFKGFSTIAGKLSPQDLVAELNDYFVAFDEIVGKYNLEKIKTIGDAYMCAGGIPTINDRHPLDAVEAGLAMQRFMIQRNSIRKEKGLDGWELRIGIHSGPVVAGVVGKKKYAYDIWGDTVNIASRMESNGEPGKVNISASTHQLVRDKFECQHRGKIAAKNIGEIDMYFVNHEIETAAVTVV